MPTHDSELHVCPYCRGCGRVALATCPPDWLDDERCAPHNCAAHGAAIANGPTCEVHGSNEPRTSSFAGESWAQWANRTFGG